MTYTDDEKTIGLINEINEEPKTSHLDKWKTRLLHLTIGLSFILFVYLSLDLIQTRSLFNCHDSNNNNNNNSSLDSSNDFAYLDSLPTNIRESNDIQDVYVKLHDQMKDLAQGLQDNVKVTRDEKEEQFDSNNVVYRDEDDYPHLAHAVKLNLV